MSKRDGNTAAVDYLKDGYLPEAILNHLMFLGWNPGTEKEIYSTDEFIKDFSLEKIHSTDLVTFNFDKLNWFNTEYLKKIDDKEFLAKLKYWSTKFNVPCLITELEKNYSDDQVLSIIRLSKERLINFSEFDKNIDYYINKPFQDSISLGKYSSSPKQILDFFYESISSVEDFNFENLDKYLHGIVKENNYSMKEYFMTLRISITGESITPPIIEIISILGKEETLNRIKSSINCF
jgi:glutamyl-tRNA synthetase